MTKILFNQLDSATKNTILSQVSRQTNQPIVAIEKDWWVVQILRLIFEMKCAESLVFKGGTSLSKAWGLIQRFSEDIDLALDRKFLGFDGELSNQQIKKLRKISSEYIISEFLPELESKLKAEGFEGVEILVKATNDSDQDPRIIEVYYPSIEANTAYIKPKVVIEIGCRSLREPFTIQNFRSLIGENFAEMPFVDETLSIPTVKPERTFLEKVFLLHEEFQKPQDKIRVDRLSRHLYDLERLMDTSFAKMALSERKLYDEIIAHRKHFTPIRGIDYQHHEPKHISIIPPQTVIKEWEKDYKIMQTSMIYGGSLTFGKLIERIRELQFRINQID
jgi:hypothetical protein